MSHSALVCNIQGYSIHDGPGIRTTVFLKGCNLECRWCQNPEDISLIKEVGFLENLCKGCGKCYKACRQGAISITPGTHRVIYDKCIACGDCVNACYYGALVMYGETMTSEEVFDKVSRDAIFYDATNGGVTISGGEPLIHAEFATSLLKQLKGAGFNTAVETAGCVPWQTFNDVMDYVDLFLFDFKMADSAGYLEYTGKPNELILDNAKALVAEGANVLFRMPLVKGVNDSDQNILAMADFMKRIRNPKLQLMPYHRMGESKYKALGKPYPMGDVPVMTAAEIEEVKAKFVMAGIDCSVSL